MTDMVERVAKAINAKSLEIGFSLKPGESISIDKLDKEFARAAIEAMREPTEAMINEAAFCGPLRVHLEPDIIEIWHDMIDAALGNTEGET